MKKTKVWNDNVVDFKQQIGEVLYNIPKKDFIEICFDETEDTGDLKIGKNEKPFNYNTLEPKILKSNDLEKLNMILGTTYANEDELHKYMRSNKTDCALKIFDTKENVSFPQYILNAIQ